MNKISNNLFFNINNYRTAFKQSAENTATGLNSFNNNYATDTLDLKSENIRILEIKAKSNPNIIRLLKEYNLPVSISKKALDELTSGHLRNTQILSANIYSSLPQDLKSKVDLKSLQDAAKYHDFGKILIPENILYKEGELSGNEWEIMKLHSQLGAELLKDNDLSEKTLNLIKYHHQNSELTGYPQIEDDYEDLIEAKILSFADEYMALTEERCYKKPHTREEALEIIKESITDSESAVIFNALVKATA